LGLVLNALLIKDQNLEENSKTYFTMLSLTIIGLEKIIPKLMPLWRRWFRHARKDFEKFATLGTKRIGTWPSLTLPWAIGRLPISPSSIIAQMDHVVDLDSLATWAKVITERAALFKRVMPMAMENLSIVQHRDTLQYAHTRWQSQT
jgi:hypothetical protein